MAQFIQCGRPANQAEVKMHRYLQDRLPDHWVILGNPTIPNRRWSPEIDAIVVGDGYVWVLDSKALRGRITGNAFEWVFEDGSTRQNPLNNIINVPKIVAGLINAKGASYPDVFVHGIIVLTANGAVLDVQDNRIEETVFPLEGVENVLINAKYRKRPTSLTDTDRKLIVERLAGLTAAKRVMIPSSPIPAKETVVSLLLVNGELFNRVYYSDEVRSFLLGKNQLRGARPKDVWLNLGSNGLQVTFVGETVGLEVLDGTGMVVVNGRPLQPSRKIKLKEVAGTLNLAGIKLEYAISRVKLP